MLTPTLRRILNLYTFRYSFLSIIQYTVIGFRHYAGRFFLSPSLTYRISYSGQTTTRRIYLGNIWRQADTDGIITQDGHETNSLCWLSPTPYIYINFATVFAWSLRSWSLSQILCELNIKHEYFVPSISNFYSSHEWFDLEVTSRMTSVPTQNKTLFHLSFQY